MAKKLVEIEKWLIAQQEIAVSNQDYTREMTLREALRKVREVRNG
jgi:hypothetical protein